MLALCRQRSPRSAHDCGGLDARRLQSEARCTLSRFRVRHHALPSCTELVRSISADSKTARSRAKVRNPHNRAAWPRRCFSVYPTAICWSGMQRPICALGCSRAALKKTDLAPHVALFEETFLRPMQVSGPPTQSRTSSHRASCLVRIAKVGLICSFVLTAEIASANGTRSAHFAACKRARRGLRHLCVQ